tara:strand:- start:14 stop:1036 length:1023 start_codon:yes stop_codon:yes gene_type:complete
MIEQLIIINNEKVSSNDNKFFCDNIDLKSIPEGLEKSFNLKMIARFSFEKKSHHINIKNIKLGTNLISFLYNVFKTISRNNIKYFIISITPYTLFAYFLLALFGKKPFVYLRSSGHEEYKYILGFLGPYIYQLMFFLVSLRCKFISCNSRILIGKKGVIVSPSQLSNIWFQSVKNSNLDKIKLLYIGRLKVEKGIYSLLKIFENLNLNAELTIVSTGLSENLNINQKNVRVINSENKNDSIIKIYDDHNIFILPSFTEGHPQVLDEALARLRPVIIFDDIAHVIGDRNGVIISKRDSTNLSNSINYIIKNYSYIQAQMKKNKLPTKKIFIEEITKIIKDK